jgi:hypothetical protein
MSDISEHEKGLCIAALRHAVKDLKAGHEASVRMRVPAPSVIYDTMKEMEDLEQKLMSSHPSTNRQEG